MGLPIVSKSRLLPLSLLAIAMQFTLACVQEGSSENQTLNSEATGVIDGATNSSDALQVLAKILVDEAEIEDLALHKVQCKLKKDESKICIEICHLPPGNPENGKDMVIPLEALKAHLNHGSDHHLDKDFLGKCQVEVVIDPIVEEPVVTDPVVIDPIVEEPVVTDPATDVPVVVDPVLEEPVVDVPEDGTVVTQPVPNWCLPFVELDNNCDGIVDATGEPLF